MQVRILLGAKCDLWSCVHALDGENMIFGGINVSEAARKTDVLWQKRALSLRIINLGRWNAFPKDCLVFNIKNWPIMRSKPIKNNAKN